MLFIRFYYFFFFNDTATTEIYTLSLHDALPICFELNRAVDSLLQILNEAPFAQKNDVFGRSEEHTSELQSLTNLVCRLLLEKKNAVDGRPRTIPSGFRACRLGSAGSSWQRAFAQ